MASVILEPDGLVEISQAMKPDLRLLSMINKSRISNATAPTYSAQGAAQGPLNRFCCARIAGVDFIDENGGGSRRQASQATKENSAEVTAVRNETNPILSKDGSLMQTLVGSEYE